MRRSRLFYWFNHRQKMPLRCVLVVPFVIQIVGAVGLVGYLSFLNGQKTVNNIANQLISEVGDRIDQNLSHYLHTPTEITENNGVAIRLGLLNWRDLSALEHYFWQQLQIFDGVNAVAIADQQKNFIDAEKRDDGSVSIRIRDRSTGYSFKNYLVNGHGEHIKLLKSNPHFDPHNDPPGDPWYRAAKESGQSTWRLVVSLAEIDNPALMAVNFQPFYDRHNTFQGVLASSVYLSQFGKFLKSLKIGRTGQAFVVERNGLLIATSTGELPFLRHITDLDRLSHPNNTRQLQPAGRRLRAVNSSNFLTQHTSQFLIERFGSLERINVRQELSFDINGQSYFVHLMPLQNNQKLDWLTVVVVPESDFMAKIYANTKTTILLCGATLLVSIGIGVLTARWIAQPILNLNALAKKIAQREFDSLVLVERTDELGELTQSFNHMAAQLKASFTKMETLNQALTESKDRLTQILEALPVGVSVHRPGGGLNYLNQTGRHILRTNITSDTTAEQLSTAYGIYYAGSDRPYAIEELPALRALKGEYALAEDMEIHRGNQVIPLEVRSMPIFDERGNVVCSVNTFQDITQRRAAEQVLADHSRTLEAQVAERTEALRESEERFRSAFDCSAIGMALIGLNDRWIKVNPVLCDLLGYSEIELLSMSASALVYSEDINQLQQCVEQVQSHKNRSVPVKLRYHSNRGRIWGLLSLSLVRNAHQPLYYVAQIQDITERQAVDRIKNEFVSIVSHELRTPLTAIRGSLGLVATGIYDNKPEKAKRMIEIALTDSERLVRLVNDILDLERLDSGKVHMDMEACEVTDLIRQAVEGMQAIADAASVTFCVMPISVQVWAASDSILQTLTNLLGNAIKFSPPNSTVWLSAELVGMEVLFKVQDRGRGIPADKLELIFGRFQQVDVSDSRHKGGTGLGLAICQSIVQQHGGQIWAESTVGEGSTFFFTLPIPARE